MKTFDDLEFHKHLNDDGKCARIFFPNGYGVSVVRFKILGGTYGSYTDNEDEWELAVLKKNAKEEDGWELCYSTPITNDVLGHLSKEQVTETMKRVQELEKKQ